MVHEWSRGIARIGGAWLPDGSMGHDPRMKSRVHPKYKIWKRCFQLYRVSNWAEHDQALVQRGDAAL